MAHGDGGVPISATKKKGSGGWIIAAVGGCALLYVSVMAAGGQGQAGYTGAPPAAGAAPAGLALAPGPLGGYVSTVDDSVANLAAPPLAATSLAATPAAPGISAATKRLAFKAAADAANMVRVERAKAEAVRAAAGAAAATATATAGLAPLPAAPVVASRKASVLRAAKKLGAGVSTRPAGGVTSVVVSSSQQLEWVAPPSQAAYGPSNPRGVPRPAMKAQSDGFLKARKATWEVGKPVLTAPMPDMYKPELTAPQRPLKTRKPFSLPAPLWDTPHTPSADAILALAVNYRIIDYVR
jgi:hypothetical protein